MKDSTANNNHGTTGGANTESVISKIGQGINFPGTSPGKEYIVGKKVWAVDGDS